MPNRDTVDTLLVAPLPPSAHQHLLLFAIRRMAAGGLDDAFAAHALVSHMGRSFRRPLVLLRALMAEASRVSNRKLVVAPCCCPRMTRDEATLIEAIAAADGQPHATHERLRSLLGVQTCLGVLTSAQAVAQCFADLGRPLSG